MPTYDYCCQNCNEIQEELHSMNEQPEIKCKKCGSICKRVISAAAFTIKGESWSLGAKMKKSMAEKNAKLKNVMNERTDGIGNNRK